MTSLHSAPNDDSVHLSSERHSVDVKKSHAASTAPPPDSHVPSLARAQSPSSSQLNVGGYPVPIAHWHSFMAVHCLLSVTAAHRLSKSVGRLSAPTHPFRQDGAMQLSPL